MSDNINIAIIGGGIIGCCVALELAKDREDIYVFEKDKERAEIILNDILSGQ